MQNNSLINILNKKVNYVQNALKNANLTEAEKFKKLENCLLVRHNTIAVGCDDGTTKNRSTNLFPLYFSVSPTTKYVNASLQIKIRIYCYYFCVERHKFDSVMN